MFEMGNEIAFSKVIKKFIICKCEQIFLKVDWKFPGGRFLVTDHSTTILNK